MEGGRNDLGTDRSYRELLHAGHGFVSLWQAPQIEASTNLLNLAKSFLPIRKHFPGEKWGGFLRYG
jgi:hypothetical protein